MGGYEYLEHKADLKIKATGKTLEEAFQQAALGAFNFIVDTETVQSVEVKQINIESKDLESLLYDFLEKLLILIDTEEFLLSNTTELKIEKTEKGYKLHAEVEGDLISEGYKTTGDIKAATYHDMEIKCDKDKCEMIFVLDI